jgi:hypothetical protein
LVNIVRPVYRYDPAATSFTPRITLSNVDTYSGNAMAVFTAAVGDEGSNVYVGSNAGNAYDTVKDCQGVTAVGWGAGAGISNVSNCVFVGSNAGVGASSTTVSNVSVGSSAGGDGSSNVRIGAGASGAGSRTVVVGAGSTSAFSDTILVGPGLTATANLQFRMGPTFLYGDMSRNWLGMGVATPTDVNTRLDVSGNVRLQGQVGIQKTPTRALDVNGEIQANDGGGEFNFATGLTTSTHGFGSLQGTVEVTGGVTEVGVLRRGLVFVSAVDQATSANRAARILFAYTVSNASEIGSNDAGSASITLDGSNIRVADAANGTYAWSITYVPLP